MVEMTFTVVKQRATPLTQLGVALAIGWAGMLVCKLLMLTGGAEYFAGLIAIIFYCLINTVVSLSLIHI